MIVKCAEEEIEINFFIAINVDIVDTYHKNKNTNVIKMSQNRLVQYAFKS
jgi:hypothetical protein